MARKSIAILVVLSFLLIASAVEAKKVCPICTAQYYDGANYCIKDAATLVSAPGQPRSESKVKNGTKRGDVCTNPEDGARMVWVPEGSFEMGSTDSDIASVVKENPGSSTALFDNEQPQHKIHLRGYWIYKYEVTVAQYREFCNATNISMPPPPTWGWIDDHPMVNVTWYEACAYAKWAGASLPTEAQWEKAARGTDKRMYPWGRNWHADRCNEPYTGPKMTQRVGNYPNGVSPYGCMDMAGNVWEYCADRYASDYYEYSPDKDPIGPEIGKYRVLRGGSWDLGHQYRFHCAYRGYASTDDRQSSIGFRCVKRMGILPTLAPKAEFTDDNGSAPRERIYLNAANGHYYAVMKNHPGRNFEEAAVQSCRMEHNKIRGYLATITSKQENDFILNLTLLDGKVFTYWLGAYQHDKNKEPGGGWEWMSREPWDFTNWAPSEPSNGGNKEDALELRPDGLWNDRARDEVSANIGFIVEFDR